MLILDPAQPPLTPWNWPDSGATVGVPKTASGCVGFQVDGPGFTEVYVVDETS